MAENGNKVNENPFHRVKEQIWHGAHRVRHFRHPVEEAPLSTTGGANPHGGPPSISEETPASMDGVANIEDLPYDSSREDPFSSELAAGAYEDDGIASPRSQSSTVSMDTLHSSVSGSSWTSTQKTIGGFGANEGRSQEVLGPYKRNSDEPALRANPADYEEYINGRKPPPPRSGSQNDSMHSAASYFERSSSTSSERSAPDSLYADLSSVSDRDLQVPEGLVKGESVDNGYDNEGRASPNNASHVREHLSNMKLHSSN